MVSVVSNGWIVINTTDTQLHVLIPLAAEVLLYICDLNKVYTAIDVTVLHTEYSHLTYTV